MNIIIIVMSLFGLALFAGIAVYVFRLAGGRRTGTRAPVKRGKIPSAVGVGDQALESRDTAVAGINFDGRCGEHRQKIIRQCRVGEVVRLTRLHDDPANPDAVGVFREDGRDIGVLPRRIASDIAEHLDTGSPVAARILALEQLETDGGEMLRSVRIELTPYRRRQSRQ